MVAVIACVLIVFACCCNCCTCCTCGGHCRWSSYGCSACYCNGCAVYAVVSIVVDVEIMMSEFVKITKVENILMILCSTGFVLFCLHYQTLDTNILTSSTHPAYSVSIEYFQWLMFPVFILKLSISAYTVSRRAYHSATQYYMLYIDVYTRNLRHWKLC